MTTQLALLAMLGALNSGRISAAAPVSVVDRRGALTVCVGALLVTIAFFAWVSAPVIDALGVSEPDARIAAGIALLVVAIRDMAAPGPMPQPGLGGSLAGLVPMMVPVAFTPAVAALAIAIGAESGVVGTVGVAVPALLLITVVVVLAIPPSWLSWITRSTALLAAVAGVLVTLDGVRSI